MDVFKGRVKSKGLNKRNRSGRGNRQQVGHWKTFLEDLGYSVDQELYSSDYVGRDCSKVEK